MPRSPQDTHVDHLRSLLDQRSTRAVSFSAISEESDTPSVYSRPFFSPKSSDNTQYHPSPTFDIESHLDHLDRPSNYTPSILDLDDQHSSFAPSEEINIDDTSYEEDEDSDFADRMSYLGPKMRVHSRAPWELEDDTHEEDPETEEGHRSFQSVVPFRGNGAKSITSSSSSPRPSYTTSRPSGESSRSQVPPKRSFDTINSQLSYQPGTFHTPVQECVSSLGQSTPPTQKNTRSKFSLGRIKSESSNVDLSSSSTPSPGRSPISARFPPIQDNDPTAKRNSVKIEEVVHPYANPELVVSSSLLEDNITLSESCTTNSEDNTVNSPLSKHRLSSIQPKIISSPLPLIGSPRLIETPLAENRLEQTVSTCSNTPSGWTDSNAPTFSLISLEEARAQRMRSATVNPSSRISAGMSNASSIFPPMENEAALGADSSPVGGSIARTRARSISAGANRARSALQTLVGQTKPERRDSEPAFIAHNFSAGHPGKTLKHKKSGFMRLFNAGKVPEKNEQKILPPVPSLLDGHSNNNCVQPIPQRTKTSVHRIPVPRLSPPLFESSRAQSHDTFASDNWKQSTRRAPGLSITINNTQQPVAGIVSASVVDDHGSQTQPPWRIEQPLQSAPANFSVFPALKLRPVSLFSDHFGDHIVDDESPDSVTPRSLSPALTPVSATQASYEQPAKYSSFDNQASMVRSLQEELAAAKKAWQLRISELEGQVRDLKTIVEELKGSDNKNYCQSCGRTTVAAAAPRSESVVNRPRARTGTSSRFTNALP